MVERLHRTLKQAIRCHDTKWTESLPVVLLGLRACIKEDLNASCAEMVFEKTIVLPGEIFEPSSQTPTDPSEFLLRLRETFRTLKPTPASCHSSTSCFVHTALKTCSHVFVRVQGLKPSLTTPYQGSFEVLSRTDKHFTIKINDRTSTISIDRLKPAFLLNDTDSTQRSPSQYRKVTIRLYFLLDLIKMCPYQRRLALVERSDSTRSTCEFS
ncbi:gag-Pol polyprotein [Trichonephila inaurata madagascariensis]|uniref:Gag-Pol polyprotein n=1 Tax=Trichonephila inaurata madagascariensis TaxID=2747483 RepID=A0A8X6IIU6_9ARAC|nr:gag-Pol polyprotein [Trichonephila inaurata madagascariensis]